MKLNIWSREQAKPQANSSMNTASQVNEHVAEEGWVLVSTSHPKKTTPLKEDGPLFGDTWTFAGKSYKAPDFCVPQPLQAAFKPSKSSEAATKPWAYDHSKFNIRGEMVD